MSDPSRPADPAPVDPPPTQPSSAGPVEPGRGLRAVVGEEFSFADAVGGVRGLVESTAPGLVFVVVYVATRALVPALVASAVVALVAVVLRLAQRAPLTQALSGVVGVGVGVAWAWTSGRAEDYFAGGLLVNAGYLVAMVASVLARWPAVGVVVALIRGESMAWRTEPELNRIRRRYVWATWVMAAVFALRLAVQVPLYLAGQVAALGTAKLAMGLPLFAVALWVTWLLVGSPAARAGRPDRRQPPPR